MKNRLLTLLCRLEFPILISLLAAFFIININRVHFHGDESHWISTSYYFEAFINGEIHSPVWDESFWTLTQPPLTRYIIGLGRTIGGYGVSDLNAPWNFSGDKQSNIEQGAMPNPGLLWWSRLPMAILAAVSILNLFIIIIKYKGRIAGYTCLLLFLGNPYVVTQLDRAMAEAPLLYSVTLAMLVAIKAVENWQVVAYSTYKSFKDLLSPLLWFLVFGIVSGCASAIKLNGALLVISGIAIAIITPSIHRGNIPRFVLFIFIIVALIIMPLTSASTYVVWNPYLYSSPLNKIGKIIHQRHEEIEIQEVASPRQNLSVLTFSNRIKTVLNRIFKKYAAINFNGAYVINLFLYSIGFLILIRDTRLWIHSPRYSSAGMVIVVIATFLALPALFTPLDWDRYYLFPIVFSTICIAIGTSIIVLAGLRMMPTRS